MFIFLYRTLLFIDFEILLIEGLFLSLSLSIVILSQRDSTSQQ